MIPKRLAALFHGRTAKGILLVTALFTVFSLLVESRLTSLFVRDGEVERAARGAVALYWALSCLAVLVVTQWRSRKREILLALASVVVTLVAAGVLIDTCNLFPAKTDPPYYGVKSKMYHHILPAERDMTMGTFEGKEVFVHSNEDGLRTPYSRTQFLSKRHRIAIMGDSFAFGWGVRGDFTVPSLTEQYVRERLKRDDIGVLNAAIPSYSPFLEKLLYAGIVRSYRPSLVLLFLDATDIGDDIVYSHEAYVAGDTVSFLLPDPESAHRGGWLARTFLPAIEYPFDYALGLRTAAGEHYDYYKFRLEIGGKVEKNRFFIYRYPLQETRPYFDATLANIRDLAREVRSDGARFVLVVAPRYHHWNRKECPKNWEHREYRIDEPYQYEYFRFFEQQRDSVDFAIFDLLPPFRQTRRFPLVFEDDPHWNENGTSFVADTLAGYLIDRGLVE